MNTLSILSFVFQLARGCNVNQSKYSRSTLKQQRKSRSQNASSIEEDSERVKAQLLGNLKKESYSGWELLCRMWQNISKIIAQNLTGMETPWSVYNIKYTKSDCLTRLYHKIMEWDYSYRKCGSRVNCMFYHLMPDDQQIPKLSRTNWFHRPWCASLFRTDCAIAGHFHTCSSAHLVRSWFMVTLEL